MAGAAVPLIVSLAGAAAQWIASEQAGSKRNRVLNQMGEDRSRYGEQSRALTDELAKQYDPATRRGVLQDLVGKREAALTQDIASANAELPEKQVQGRVSEAYTADRAGKAVTEAQRRVDLTRLLSKVLAPNDLRTEEGFKTADSGALQSTLNTNLRGMNAARQTDLARIRPDSALMLGGSLAQGAGQGLAYADYAKKLDSIYDGLFAGAKKPGKVPISSLGGNV